MIVKKNCVAMLLAGGQGSRLYALTQNRAKPAVPYGGKYKIIDFPLSNCIHSGIDTVGVLTQYEPLELNAYIGNGATWDLDCMSGGAYVLPPYVKGKKGEWYSGTASAIFQNIHFIDQYDPDYILVLSGDHIYTMDYDKMIQDHAKNGADATIAVMEVPMEEASRFGIMNTDDQMRIVEFEEKPPVPKNNLASMGIYVFSWKKVKQYLIADSKDPESSNDFGKNIIPNMLNNGEKMMAYLFDGYWKDVGTIDSLWEANMDLLDPNVPLDLYDDSWKIYSRNPVMPPHFVASGAKVENSMITEGCHISGDIDFSILFAGVTVEEGAVVHDSIVMPGTVIKKGAVVEYAIVAENCVIGENAVVGMRPEDASNRDDWGVTVVGNGVAVGAGAVVPPKAMVDKDVEGVR